MFCVLRAQKGNMQDKFHTSDVKSCTRRFVTWQLYSTFNGGAVGIQT